MSQEILMKLHGLPLLALTSLVFAQDISSQSTYYQVAATSQGTIDQPWSVATGSTSTEPDRPAQPLAVLTVSAPLPTSAPMSTIAPLSPDLPQSPLLALSTLLPQQPQQAAQSLSPSGPQKPMASPNQTAPVILNSAEGLGSANQTSAQTIANRTFESLQNASNILSNLIKVKTN